jgi:hypothetical protein
MTILKNRWIALLLTIIIMLLSTAFSVHRTLGAECQKVEDGFYNGVSFDGYAHKSISSQLEKRSDAVNGIVSIMANYPDLEDESAELRDARNALLDAADIDDKSKSNLELQKAFEVAAATLAGAGLTERESAAVTEYTGIFTGAQNVIDNSGYNESVREFQRSTLNVFPTNIISNLLGVKTPELFE